MSRHQNGNASNMASRVNHRITVLGDGGVGKTALVVQFTMSQFVETYDPTIEDCYRRLWVVDDQACLLEVLDTAGQEEYTALRNQWIKDGEGFILVYSIASSASFSRIPDIFDRVLDTKRMQGEDRPPIIIVGNKCDRGQTDREVSVDSGRQQAFDLGADAFFEVSARTNYGVENAFRSLVRLMSDRKNGSPPNTSNGSANGNGGAMKEYGGGGGGNSSLGGGSGGGGGGQRRKKKKRNCVIL